MVEQVQQDQDLECVMKLYDAVQRVKQRNKNNSEQIDQLKQLFDKLNGNIQEVMKASKNTDSAGLVKEKKGATPSAKDKK